MTTPEKASPAELPGADCAIVPAPKFSFSSMIASPEELHLSPQEQQELESYQTSLVILGPAAGSVLVCPGNQENVADQDKCPYSAKCPLLRAQKAPENKLCPIELKLVEERFGAWCQTIEQEPLALKETDRVTVSDLVWIDVQVQRSQHMLSKGEEARLTVINTTDVDSQGNAVAWERVIHPLNELLATLLTQRRMILKDWMLTPEQKWKMARAEGKGSGKDLASRQSGNIDKLRRLESSGE